MEVIKLAYGYTLTSAGRTLLLQLQAGEVSPFVISRIAVGDGEVPDGTNPATLTGLIHEVVRSQATCTVPIVEADTLSFEIEYRNKWDADTFYDGYTDPTGLTESFWLKEYGIFALDSNGNEILLYYANLGEFPESVARWNGRNLVSKRYPVSISIVDDDTDVELAFPAHAFITSDYLESRLAASGGGVVFSADRPTGDWNLWLQDLGEADEVSNPFEDDGTLLLMTAPVSEPGEFIVEDEDGAEETVTNMTDNQETAGQEDIIAAD
jgi:hypothetical protein